VAISSFFLAPAAAANAFWSWKTHTRVRAGSPKTRGWGGDVYLIVTLEGTWVFISIEVAIAPAARWFCPVL
tara:strand:+ start:718 stop:930 length:213 start_codon:yes stop_codon:yes gene_type:complete